MEAGHEVAGDESFRVLGDQVEEIVLPNAEVTVSELD
jgi:hypothetical protein